MQHYLRESGDVAMLIASEVRNGVVRKGVLIVTLILMIFAMVQWYPQLLLNRFLVSYVTCFASDCVSSSQSCAESLAIWNIPIQFSTKSTQENVAFWVGHYALCQQGDQSTALEFWRPSAKEVVFRVLSFQRLFNCCKVQAVAIARSLNVSTSTVDYFAANQLLSEGRADEAAIYYERALQTDDFDERLPGREESFWSLARYHINQSNWEQAIPILESGLKTCNECWIGHYLLGISYLRSDGSSDVIIQHLAEAQRLNPRWSGVYPILIEELISTQRYAEAKDVALQGVHFLSPMSDTYQYLLEALEQLP